MAAQGSGCHPSPGPEGLLPSTRPNFHFPGKGTFSQVPERKDLLLLSVGNAAVLRAHGRLSLVLRMFGARRPGRAAPCRPLLTEPRGAVRRRRAGLALRSLSLSPSGLGDRTPRSFPEVGRVRRPSGALSPGAPARPGPCVR